MADYRGEYVDALKASLGDCMHERAEELKELQDAYERLAMLEEALEKIGGLDCVQAEFRVGKPCGVCVSCIARSALQRRDDHG